MNIEIKYYLKPLCLRSDKEQEARDEVNKIINEVHFVGTLQSNSSSINQIIYM